MVNVHVPKAIFTTFLVSLSLLLLTFGLELYSLNRLVSKANWVEHTNQVLLRLENILSILKDAEVGQRGYLLTNNPEFLNPYNGSYQQVLQSYQQTRTLTRDNLSQQKRLDTLRQLIIKRFAILKQTIALEKKGEPDSAKAIVITQRGKYLMDSIRALVNRMETEELRLKEIRYDQVKTSSVATPIFILFASFLAILICIVAYRITKKEIIKTLSLHQQLAQSNQEIQQTNLELRRAETNLKLLNATLEVKVAERTAYLSQAKDELNTLNQELFRQNEKLNRVNTDLDNFVYAASHDLKAPITNIEGLVNLIKESECYQDVEARELIDRISISGTKLRNAIEDLSVVIRVQNQVELVAEQIPVAEILEDICISIADLLQASQVQINLQTDPDAAIYFSKKNFRSILYNLIHNAIEYRAYERLPKILIVTEKIPGYTVLSVKDNGLGFNPTKKDNIFTLFKRLHNHVEGSGVGLFIVKRMMDNAGGRVEVESEVNAGTTFRLYFPV
ncbi:sensor histidine kinase [Adhaeribacter pallidiroseus]|uniref:histidine kinase n=1 Tax=Adhaeribacter pallidiroseus TaxID=2072847 RepID=A0A369QI74_9BACT|nr:CHASE3 domain-containing protein [Adhaeribacter pallidiroseus]RDC61998.1 Methanoproteinis regulatory histidine kinase FilI [Adhaeribacter pallidiroseus]